MAFITWRSLISVVGSRVNGKRAGIGDNEFRQFFKEIFGAKVRREMVAELRKLD